MGENQGITFGEYLKAKDSLLLSFVNKKYNDKVGDLIVKLWYRKFATELEAIKYFNFKIKFRTRIQGHKKYEWNNMDI